MKCALGIASNSLWLELLSLLKGVLRNKTIKGSCVPITKGLECQAKELWLCPAGTQGLLKVFE